MLDYSSQDIVDVLNACPNLNSAVKGFLKNETGGDQKAVKFAKAFRKAALSPRGILEFVEKYHSDYRPHLLAIARQGHTEVIGEFAESVITEYADRFNETYEKDGDSITVKNQGDFESITRDVHALLNRTLDAAGLPPNGFLKTVVIEWLYDPEVLPEVAPLFKEK